MQAFLARHFQGGPINPQNIVKWKQPNHSDWLVKKLCEEVMAANENPDPALIELRNAGQNYIRDLQLENMAWYRQGFADALAGASPNN